MSHQSVTKRDVPRATAPAPADPGEPVSGGSRRHGPRRRPGPRGAGRSAGARPGASAHRRRAARPQRAACAPGRRELGQALPDESHRVGLVVDREAARVAELVGVGAQDPRARRVEGHHPHRAGLRPHQLPHALAHLGRGLVGEGDREDLAGACLPGADQIGDPASLICSPLYR